MINLAEAFEKFEDEYLKFERVANKLHPRPDICAWLMLDKLVTPKSRDMVCSAGHDEIWLDVDCDELAKVATEQDIETLVRCGIRYSNEHNALCMFA